MKINFYKLFSLVFLIGAVFLFSSRGAQAQTVIPTITFFNPTSASVVQGNNLGITFRVTFASSGGATMPPNFGGRCNISGAGVSTVYSPYFGNGVAMLGSITVGPINSNTTLALTCNDSNLTNSASVTIPVNMLPTVNAGPDVMITTSATSTSITGSASDISPGTISSTVWSISPPPAFPAFVFALFALASSFD